jgi:hypothetical protein
VIVDRDRPRVEIFHPHNLFAVSLGHHSRFSLLRRLELDREFWSNASTQ